MNQKTPIISVMIPTLQSEAFIEGCLESIKAQNYPALEVILIDGGSTDATIARAQKIIPTIVVTVVQDGLLRARVSGIKLAQGEYGLLLDADQILTPQVLTRAVSEIEAKHLDMLVFEEMVYEPKTLLEQLFVLDRKLIHAVKDFSPETGVMLPRFFKMDLLRKAVSSIPEDALSAGDRDHAIIYAEAFALSQHIDLVSDAVYHKEPSSFIKLIKKFYRWGYTNLPAQHPRYRALLAKKEGFRKGMFTHGLILESFGSALLLLCKGVPYKIGYFVAWIQKKF